MFYDIFLINNDVCRPPRENNYKNR